MIEVSNFNPMDHGALKAKFTIKVAKWGDFIIHGLAMFEKDGKRWVSLPTHKIDVQGKEKWVPMMLYEKPELNKKFLAQIQEALEVFLMKV